MTIELKACPFCGSDGDLYLPTCRPETPYDPTDRLFPYVRCRTCYAEALGKNEDYRGDTAIVAWNARTPDAASPALLEALENLLRASQPQNSMQPGFVYIGEAQDAAQRTIALARGTAE